MSDDFVSFVRVDGSGPVDINPDAVKDVQPYSDKPARWSVFTLLGDHEFVVEGICSEVHRKLGARKQGVRDSL